MKYRTTMESSFYVNTNQYILKKTKEELTQIIIKKTIKKLNVSIKQIAEKIVDNYRIEMIQYINKKGVQKFIIRLDDKNLFKEVI